MAKPHFYTVHFFSFPLRLTRGGGASAAPSHTTLLMTFVNRGIED